MRVLVKEPGKDPRSMEIVNELDALQDLVGGYIEPIRMADGLVMIVNEEGKLHGLEPNFFVAALNDMILGPAVFCGEDGEEFADINEEDLIVLQTFFSISEDIRGGK
jgi:hypothetical protein